MTAAFERAEDLHTLTAKKMLRLNDPDSWLSLPEAERKQHRKRAKPVNFGRLYGQGANGLVASAREQYGLILDLATAKAWTRAFQETYPDFTRWCRDFARACERSGRIPIGRQGGRIHEIYWNSDGLPLHPVSQSTDSRRLRGCLHAGAGDDRRDLVRGGDRRRPGCGAAR
jgi:DNA polymerase family A